MNDFISIHELFRENENIQEATLEVKTHFVSNLKYTENHSICTTNVFEQADLPQILQSYINSQPQLKKITHLICIDTSQIIDINNPIPEIYDQMVDNGCTESEKIPETTTALKLYYKSLKRKSDRRLVLLFYESQPKKQTLDDYFLSDISKFGDKICVITNEPKDNISLKFFIKNQPVEDFLTWLHQLS